MMDSVIESIQQRQVMVCQDNHGKEFLIEWELYLTPKF